MSEAKWTLSVEDFGPIKSASMTLARFTVFTGHNNAGKSYMASLIWATLNSPEILSRPGAQRGPAFEVVSEMVSEIRSGRKSVVEGQDWEKLVDWLNVAINGPSLGIIGRIFACGDFRGAGCRINLLVSGSPLNSQRVLARALVRLVNPGTSVLVTTHSDIFIHQINILMHLHKHPKRAELAAGFGYDDNELLNPADALGYRFEPGKDGTVVQAMCKTTSGFVEPAMNGKVAAQTHENYRMECADEDA